MIKIPVDLAKAAEASFPTFVDEGRLFLRIRRTQARGGSNSTADDGPCLAVSAGALEFGVVVVLIAGNCSLDVRWKSNGSRRVWLVTDRSDHC